MKRLLSLILVVAMLLSVCTLFTACEPEYGSSDEEEEEEEKRPTPTYVLNGLEIVLPKEFDLIQEEDYDGSKFVRFSNDEYHVYIYLEAIAEEDKDMTAKDYVDRQVALLESAGENIGKIDSGKKNGTPYAYAETADGTQAAAISAYVSKGYLWEVNISNLEDNLEYDKDDMVSLITGWYCKYTEDKTEPADTTPSNSGNVLPEAPNYVGNFQIPSEGYDGSEVTIVFYHTMGYNLQSVLDNHIAEFNKLYPNIHIKHYSVGSYDDLYNQISTEITYGQQPNIAYCYPQHVAQYNLAGVVVTLDDLMASNILVTNAYGTTEALGISYTQYNDFIPGFLASGSAYEDGMQYSMPLSKSTELMYYNKTFFEQHNLSVPTTLEELYDLCYVIKSIDPNCIPLGYDSDANLFINYCYQTGSGYFDELGNPLFYTTQNVAFGSKLYEMYNGGLLITQNLYGSYTSNLFTEEYGTRCYMTIGSSAGASYNVPLYNSFEVGVAPIPQADPYHPKTICQGPDLCMFQNEDPQEVVASWLFMKFLTTSIPFQAEFSMASGYLPVLQSVINHPNYQTFLSHANGSDYITAMAALVSLQNMNSFYIPNAFVDSDYARELMETLVYWCMVYYNTDQSFQDILYEWHNHY